MASTFAELYSDFQIKARIYTEKLPVTEFVFMRYLTKGMQLFQRKSNYVEYKTDVYKAWKGRVYNGGDNITDVANVEYYVLTDDITYNGTTYTNTQTFTSDGVTIVTAGAGTFALKANEFNLPTEALMILEVKDDNDQTLIIQDWTQFTRNVELWADGFLETPVNYGYRLMPTRLTVPAGNVRASSYHEQKPRMVSLFNRILHVYPIYLENTTTQDTVLTVWYIPDLHPISQNSDQWSTGITNNDWFPYNQNFMNMFRKSMINNTLSTFEDAFVNYALYEYIATQGQIQQAQFYKSLFDEELKWAIANKPRYFKEGVGDYHIAPWS